MVSLGGGAVSDGRGYEDPRPHGQRTCCSHGFVPEFSPKGHMALHPPYNRVKAIGAIASHQLWTIGVVALPHTSHTPLCYPQFATRLTRGEHPYFFLISPSSPLG